jgi:FKBP-type peptidyl-prolyl cis-trans isomerase FklB
VIAERQALNKERLYGPNRVAGEKFLEENKVKDGVKTTASGLQYKVLTMGTGEIPTITSKVNVDYEGKLIDGKVFDSSYERGQPTSFRVNQVIKGWTEALQLMPVGSEWELYIPYQLAYGENEAGKTIKPYSALIFKVKLHGIEQ